MDHLLLTVEQAAERLALSRSKTYELVAAGKIASIKIGKCRRVPRGALDEFIRQHLQPSLVPAEAGSPLVSQ